MRCFNIVSSSASSSIGSHPSSTASPQRLHKVGAMPLSLFNRRTGLFENVANDVLMLMYSSYLRAPSRVMHVMADLTKRGKKTHQLELRYTREFTARNAST